MQNTNWKKNPSPAENCFTGTKFDPKKIDATKHPIKPIHIGIDPPASAIAATVVVFPFVSASIVLKVRFKVNTLKGRSVVLSKATVVI